MDYLTLMRNRIEGKESRVPYQLGHKIHTHDFCRITGIPTPNLLAKFETPGEIVFDELPEEFVIKPAYSSTSAGVMVLRRDGDLYYDAMSKSVVSKSEIVALQQNVYDKHSSSKSRYTLVEEKVVDAGGFDIPIDYKFLAFQGVVGLIIRIDRLHDKLRLSYYDGEFRPIVDDRIRFNDDIAVREQPHMPKNWEQLLNAARRLSHIVPTPCARIDLFDSTRGPLLGEFTLTPGSFYYSAGHRISQLENDRLGQLWLEAEQRLWGSVSERD